MKRMRGGGGGQMTAHLGGPGMQDGNALISSGQVDVLGDNVYYNATISNTQSVTDSLQGRQASYRDRRDKPVLSHPEEYEMSVLRMVVDTTTLPIFQPRAAVNQPDPDLLDYKVGYRLDWSGCTTPELGLMTVPALSPVPISSSSGRGLVFAYLGASYENLMPFPQAGAYTIAGFMGEWNAILAQQSLSVSLQFASGGVTFVRPQFTLVNGNAFAVGLDFSAEASEFPVPLASFASASAPVTVGVIATANFVGAPHGSLVVNASAAFTMPNFFKIGPIVDLSLTCFKSLYWTPEDKTALKAGPPLYTQDYGNNSSSTYYSAFTMNHVLDRVVNPAIENVLYTANDFDGSLAYFNTPDTAFTYSVWAAGATYAAASLVAYKYVLPTQKPFSVVANCTVSGNTLVMPANTVTVSNPPPAVGMIVLGAVTQSPLYTTVTAVALSSDGRTYTLSLSQAVPGGVAGGVCTFVTATTGYFYTVDASSVVGTPPIVGGTLAASGALSAGWFSANIPLSGLCLQRQLSACMQARDLKGAAWSSSGSYVPGQGVVYLGVSYVAKNAIVSGGLTQQPPSINTGDWLSVGANPYTSWNVSAAYAQPVAGRQSSGSLVTFNGEVFSCIQTPAVGTAPTAGGDAFWSSVLSPVPVGSVSGGFKQGGYYLNTDGYVYLALGSQSSPPGATPPAYSANFQQVQYFPARLGNSLQCTLTSSPAYFAFNENTNLFSMYADTYSTGGQTRDSAKVSAATNSMTLFTPPSGAVKGYAPNYSLWPGLPITTGTTTVGNVVPLPWNGQNPFFSAKESLTFITDANFQALFANFPVIVQPSQNLYNIYNAPVNAQNVGVPVAYEWIYVAPSEEVYVESAAVAAYPNQTALSLVPPTNYSATGLRIFNTASSYYVYRQESISTSNLWCPVTAIALTTESIPVVTELEGVPLNLTSSSGGYATGDSGAVRRPIISDFAIAMTDCFAYRSTIYYAPAGEYRMTSLSNREMFQLDFSIWWRHRVTQDLVPLLLNGAGGYASVKFLFRPKHVSHGAG